jgi:hypothetical protein
VTLLALKLKSLIAFDDTEMVGGYACPTEILSKLDCLLLQKIELQRAVTFGLTENLVLGMRCLWTETFLQGTLEGSLGIIH